MATLRGVDSWSLEPFACFGQALTDAGPIGARDDVVLEGEGICTTGNHEITDPPQLVCSPCGKNG